MPWNENLLMKPNLKLILVAALIMVLQACGGEPQPSESASAETQTAATAELQRSPSPPGATVFIISPVNGTTVASPVTVKFGISGMTVVQAGDFANNTGHHHLLIDVDPKNDSLPVPSDKNHIHFGKGQTETTIELEPGQHSLQLVLGDGNHIPHNPPVVSEKIIITVK
jgi:hypothetical protein